MKVLIDGILIDSEKQLITLVFDTDENRKHIAKILTEMPDNDDTRLLAVYPDSWCKGDVDMSRLLETVRERERGIVITQQTKTGTDA